MKANKVLTTIFSVFAALGLIFLIIGIVVMIKGIQFKEEAVEVNATISDIEYYRDSDGDAHYRTYVNYMFGGLEYEDVELNTYNSSMYIGKEITILMNPRNPYNISAPYSDMIVGIIFASIGTVFVVSGIIPMLIMLRKSSKKKKLKEQGRYIYAIVDYVDINTNLSLNGRNPYVMYCSYRDEYKDVIYRFKSDNLWTDPYPHLQQGSQVRVFVNGQDYSQYHVDVEGSLQGKIVDYT